jgi:hypothetical protein
MKQVELFALTPQERICGLLAGKWLTPYDLQKEYHELTGVWMSDAGASARIRDLRKEKYGRYDVQKRRVPGKDYYEYSVPAPGRSIPGN